MRCAYLTYRCTNTRLLVATLTIAPIDPHGLSPIPTLTPPHSTECAAGSTIAPLVKKKVSLEWPLACLAAAQSGPGQRDSGSERRAAGRALEQLRACKLSSVKEAVARDHASMARMSEWDTCGWPHEWWFVEMLACCCAGVLPVELSC